MQPKYKVGQKYTDYTKKHQSESTIIDILTTTNSFGFVIKIEYLTENPFMGQMVTAIVGPVRIARSLAA